MVITNSLLRQIFIILVALLVLKLTKYIAAPVVLAIVTGVILSPLLDTATRYNVPPAITAGLATIGTCALCIGGLVVFAPVLEQAIYDVPRVIDAVHGSLEGLLRLGEDIERVSEEVGDAIGASKNGGGGAASLPSLVDAALVAPQLAGQALVFLGTLFFFLMTREDVYHWAAGIFGGPGESDQFQEMVRNADRSVSRYFLTITAINFLLGCAVSVGLYLFDFPSPAVWGLAAFLLNYLLYLGPMLFALSLLFFGHLEFSGLMAFAPMAMFVTMNFLEGYLMTPTFVGQRLAINPLVVFLTLTVGLWIWGVVGGVVSLPVLVWVLAAAGVIEWSDPQDRAWRLSRIRSG